MRNDQIFRLWAQKILKCVQICLNILYCVLKTAYLQETYCCVPHLRCYLTVGLRKMWKHFIYIKRCHRNKHLYMCIYSCITSRFIFHGLTTSRIYLWIYILDFWALYVFLLIFFFLLFLWFFTIGTSFRQHFQSPFHSPEFPDEIIDGATTASGMEPMYVFLFISVWHPLQWWLIIKQ